MLFQRSQHSIALDPLDVELQLNSSQIFISSGRIDEAIALAESALEKNPEFVFALRALGNIYLCTGDFSKAVEIYLRILAIIPNDTGIQFRVAGMLRELGQYGLAHRWIDRTETLDPEGSAFDRWAVCLGQNDKLELRPLLRDGISDIELRDAIRYAITLKPERHEFNEQPEQIVRFMSVTGG